MGDRLLVLLVLGALGALVLFGYGRYRRRAAPALEWVDVSDFGLELMTSCCAFIVFTSPSCRSCRTVMKLLEDFIEDGVATELRRVNALERPDLAVRYEVKTVPTTFLITASGHVIGRWSEIPPRQEVAGALSVV